MTTLQTVSPRTESISDRWMDVLDLHFHPRHGSTFWLERSAGLGINVPRDVRTVEDLSRLGTMTPSDLLNKPLRHFVPRALHDEWSDLVVGQTGGTTGPGAWSAYLESEFEEAFVTPFAVAAEHVGFPRSIDWLYIGPSGPHIIGKVVRSLASSLESSDPFSVDFDPRWAKKLPPDSLAFVRYLDHVVQQALDVISQQDIGVLFTTPAVLARLAKVLSPSQRESIQGVHYGGMALSPVELEHFQTVLFPNAVHLSGYGNTLFGCCLELQTTVGRPLDYFPYGDRLWFEVVDEHGAVKQVGETGQVCFTRMDRSMMIVRMLERDEATLISTPTKAPVGFRLCGVRDPHSPRSLAPTQRPGLY